MAGVRDVREGRTLPVPKHLRDSHYPGAAKLGHGQGYRYAHNYEGGFVEQDYLGVDKQYYVPTDRGYEAQMRTFLNRVHRRRSVGNAGGAPQDGATIPEGTSDRTDLSDTGPGVGASP